MVIFAISGYYYDTPKEWIQLCSLWLVSRNEFDSDRSVWPQKGVVDLVHGLPNRVVHMEVSNQSYQQHVQVLLSKPETTEMRTWKKRTFVMAYRVTFVES